MRRIGQLLIGLTLLALLVAGCAGDSSAGQDNADATVGGQAAANLAPSPEVVDPAEADSQSAAAGETPSVLGSTPEAGQVGAWERHRFFDVWDVGYPDGWTVDRPGDGSVVLTGAYGERQYRVELVRPTDAAGEDLPNWVQADLAKIEQTGAPRSEVRLTTLDAIKVTNLQLPQQANDCPAVRLYTRANKLASEDHYLIVTVTQADDGECDTVNLERLADALGAELRT